VDPSLRDLPVTLFPADFPQPDPTHLLSLFQEKIFTGKTRVFGVLEIITQAFKPCTTMASSDTPKLKSMVAKVY
jgi:hypothetical protein